MGNQVLRANRPEHGKIAHFDLIVLGRLDPNLFVFQQTIQNHIDTAVLQLEQRDAVDHEPDLTKRTSALECGFLVLEVTPGDAIGQAGLRLLLQTGDLVARGVDRVPPIVGTDARVFHGLVAGFVGLADGIPSKGEDVVTVRTPNEGVWDISG